MKPVALVSMPTLSGRFPSFQLALLEPTLARAGIPAQSFSLYMYFGAFVGWRLHEVLAEVWPSMVGEWLFARAAFGEFASDDEYFARHEANFRTISRLAGCTIADIRRVRDEVVPRFLDFCVERIDWRRFGLIGMSVLFQQNCASFALARRLKERHPEIPIILGGGTFEDEIADEIMRRVPAIDMIHCGDADTTFPEIVRRLDRGEPVRGAPGLFSRDGAEIVFGGRAPNHEDMSATPAPDFDEWFYARRESGYDAWPGAEEPMLPIETARGCWWGEKSHCTFCGLNRAGMAFRAKDVPSVLAMLEALARRYGVFHFNAIDNIMAPSYIERLFGALAAAGADFRLHYEVRASLTREQLRRMREGGLVSVQPGVESFSTHVLRLMGKGTTAVRNLEFVKWCTYFDIRDSYNILLGFPGETREDYRLQEDLVAKIHHLEPPYTICKARPDRGSPMFTDPAAQGVARLVPQRCYEYIFPKDVFDLRRVSYYFEHETERTLAEREYDGIYAAVLAWQERWKRAPRPFLRYRKSLETILIEDGRALGAPRKHALSGPPARLYEFCADAHGRAEIAARFGGEPWVEAALADFIAKDLMVHLDGRYLALALPASPFFGRSAAAARPEAQAAPPAAEKPGRLPIVA
jgi:ribosomal peptide maturation radical SAM protein 1